MKKLYTLFLFTTICLAAQSQTYWTGLALDGLWATPGNWTPGLPTSTSDVVIDNLHGSGSGGFTVTLPSTAVSIKTLTITPSGSFNITVLLPVTNTASPGLLTTGSIYINNGGTLKNSSTAASVPTITIGSASTDSMYIYNGGTYEHNTGRSVSSNTPNSILDKMSTGTGTEYGRLHFNIPVSGTTALSMQGRTFGSLEFSAGSAPSALTYSSSGTAGTALTVRGNFKINSPAAFSSTITGNILVAGNFENNGTFSYSPSTSAAATRSLQFNGSNTQLLQGTGTFTLGMNFRNMEIVSGAKVSLLRNITLPNAGNSFIINNGGTLLTNTSIISGTGTFTVSSPTGTLGIGSPAGITVFPAASGNIQTTIRNYNLSNYEYNSTSTQATGTGLPGSVKNLVLNTTGYQTVTLTSSVNIDDNLSLQNGFLSTTANIIPNLRDTTEIISPSNNYGSSNIGWERSCVLGPISGEINSSVKKWFPVGKISGTDTLFAPAAITTTYTGPVTDTVEYFATPYSDLTADAGQLDHISKIERWYISSNTSGTIPNGKVTLSWRPQSAVGDGNPAHDGTALNDLMVAHYFDIDGAGPTAKEWSVDGGSATVCPKTGTVSYGTITTSFDNGITLVTDPFISPNFTLGTRSAFNTLPLTLLEFAAATQQNIVEVKWKTTQEHNVNHYDLQRSANGLDFNTIGKVNSVNAQSNYIYNGIDLSPLTGWNYYRLSIFDNAGKASFSRIIKVWNGKMPTISLYPNPATNKIKINLPVSSSIYEIGIVNSSGQLVKQLTSSDRTLTINIESLSKGVYFIHILNCRQAIAQKFTKQ